jgi:hypothetical protein
VPAVAPANMPRWLQVGAREGMPWAAGAGRWLLSSAASPRAPPVQDSKLSHRMHPRLPPKVDFLPIELENTRSDKGSLLFATTYNQFYFK